MGGVWERGQPWLSSLGLRTERPEARPPPVKKATMKLFCEDNVCLLHQRGLEGDDISDQQSANLHQVLKEAHSSFGGDLEVPGAKVYNLIVSKKSIFQGERPCCVCLIRKWTRGLEKRIVAVRLVIDGIIDGGVDFTKVAVSLLEHFCLGRHPSCSPQTHRHCPAQALFMSHLFRAAWQHPDLWLQPPLGHLPMAATGVCLEYEPDCDSVLFKKIP